MASGGSSIPARGRLGSAGKGRGSAQGLTYDRFRGLDGSEGVPARGLGGTTLWQPLRPVFRQTGLLAWNTSDLGSSRGAVGRPRKVVWLTVWFGRESSSCDLQWRPAAVSARRLCNSSRGEVSLRLNRRRGRPEPHGDAMSGVNAAVRRRHWQACAWQGGDADGLAGRRRCCPADECGSSTWWGGAS
jgi:hypothetical protein